MKNTLLTDFFPGHYLVIITWNLFPPYFSKNFLVKIDISHNPHYGLPAERHGLRES